MEGNSGDGYSEVGQGSPLIITYLFPTHVFWAEGSRAKCLAHCVLSKLKVMERATESGLVLSVFPSLGHPPHMGEKN